MTKEAPKNYRVVELRVDNFKRISAVEIRPDEDIVALVGDTDQGKTSVLDAIEAALRGTRFAPADPIKEGSKAARIHMDLGDLVITRTFKEKDDGKVTSTLKVISKSGMKFTSDQDLLNSIYNAIACDPIAFTNLSPKEQFDIAKAFVPGIDFAEVARQDKELREERRVVGNRVDDLKAQVAAFVLPPGKVPTRVDVAAMEKILDDAAETNAGIERRKANREAAETRCQGHADRAAGLRAQAAALIEQAVEEEGLHDNLRAQIDNAEPLPEPVDVTATREALNAARETNKTVDKVEERAALARRLATAEAEVEELTTKITGLEEAKREAIANSSMPVEGLTFGDDEVLLNGHPFSQASRRQQILAGVAIAAELNPQLRVIQIRDAAVLGPRTGQGWKDLVEFAAANDLQVWLERQDYPGEVGFIIEDGYLQGMAPEEDAEVI